MRSESIKYHLPLSSEPYNQKSHGHSSSEFYLHDAHVYQAVAEADHQLMEQPHFL